MMDWGVMLGDIVAFVVTARCPIVPALFLADSVAKPVKFHVHGFELFHDIVVDNADLRIQGFDVQGLLCGS